MAQGKPQYRTLVKALDELHYAAWDVLEPFTERDLKERHRVLRRAAVNAEEMVARARAWAAGKEQRAEEAQQKKAERAASEFV